MIYDSFKADLVMGEVSPRDALYVMLVRGYKPVASHSKRSDVVAFEVKADGYTAGGKACDCSVQAGPPVKISIAPVQWRVTGMLSAEGAVVYKARGGPAADDNLIGFLDFGKLVTCTDSSFTAHFQDGIVIP
jgi:hypothetical protein